ncbi:ABC transporter ATP-binding protein [Candidatus Electronema sp. TJ]|uniref:ABC transporter ATP-binding protein n=1 Tax=Candidatus Electronema sp. TJ TaxID=3401573 RepID=UPI003AA82123
MSDTVIQIEGLWKEYRLGVIGHGTLTRDLQSWWARVRGKEDPNSKIQSMLAGQEKQVEGDRFWALRDINLEVKEGEILGIIGRNGAGKSTLLKLLSRVTAPTKGQIKIKGRIASLLEVGTGFHPELTGRENIFMNGAILGMSKQEIKTKLDEIIDFSGVEKFIDTPVKRYSSGMYVRLAFAVAAHLEPEILVVDEVLAVGDAEFQKKCLGKMGEVSRAGRTVLFVSHNMAMISTLCKKGLLLECGFIVRNDQISEVVLLFYDKISDVKNIEAISTGDEFCRFVNASIVNKDGSKTQQAEMCDEIKIVMTYDILQETTDSCVPNYHLFTAEGQYVCCMNSPSVVPMKAGRYRAECTVPPFLLNEGAYTVGCAVTSYHKNNAKQYTINFYEKNILIFNIVDKKNPDEWNYGFATKIPGVIRPRLSWNIQAVT